MSERTLYITFEQTFFHDKYESFTLWWLLSSLTRSMAIT